MVPVLTITQVFALADAFTDRRYRLLILLAVFCSLRWGELAALARYCVDAQSGIVSVRASVAELARGPLITAALVYQHRTMHRDKVIADAMGRRAEAEIKRSGTQRARGQGKHS